MFQRKSPAKRSAKSYQDEVSEKKPRTIKRGIIKEETGKIFAESTLPTDEIYNKIRERAYQIYQRRCGSQGDDMSDWLQAEKEIIAEISGTKSNLN